jgi:hypothetical protein
MIPHPITQNPERPLIRDLPFAIVIACERVLKLLASVVTGSSRIEASLGYSRGGNIFPDLRSSARFANSSYSSAISQHGSFGGRIRHSLGHCARLSCAIAPVFWVIQIRQDSLEGPSDK